MVITAQGEIGVNAGSVVLDTEDVVVYRFDTRSKYAMVYGENLSDGVVRVLFMATERTLNKTDIEGPTVVEIRDPRFTEESGFRVIEDSGRYSHDVIFYRVKGHEDQVWTNFEESP